MTKIGFIVLSFYFTFIVNYALREYRVNVLMKNSRYSGPPGGDKDEAGISATRGERNIALRG